MVDVIFDTDIGDDIDDALALTLLLRSPELTLKAVVTNNRYEGERALIASKLLSVAGCNDIPVYEGTPGGKGKLSQGEFINDYCGRAAGSYGDFLLFLNDLTSAQSERPVYLSLGCLTNVASLFQKLPHVAQALRLVIMGGALERDYKGNRRLEAEWNIYSDIDAAKEVFGSGMEISMVGLDATWDIELPPEDLRKLTRSGHPLNRALGELLPQWRAFYPERRLILYDPFTVGTLIDESLARWEKVRVEVDDQGRTRKREGGAPCKSSGERRQGGVPEALHRPPYCGIIPNFCIRVESK